MKKAILFFLFCATALRAEIYEIKNFEQLRKVIDQKTLILLDIDNTLIRPAQTLGSDQWFDYQFKCYRNSGMSSENALERALVEWEGVQNISRFQSVEKETPSLISKWQEEGYQIIALTIRNSGLSSRTFQQLACCGIDFTRNSFCQDELYICSKKPMLYKKGILFTDGQAKGKALMELLDKIHCTPKRIVFIDDKRRYLESVERACDERSIPFVGLRYSYLDEWVKSFSPAISDLQMDRFRKIMSDEEAEKILAEKNSALVPN